MPLYIGPEKESIPYTARLIRTFHTIVVTEPNDVLRFHHDLLRNELEGHENRFGYVVYSDRDEADACLMSVTKRLIFIYGQGQGLDLPSNKQARKKTAQQLATMSLGSVVLYSHREKPKFWNWRLALK